MRGLRREEESSRIFLRFEKDERGVVCRCGVKVGGSEGEFSGGSRMLVRAAEEQEGQWRKEEVAPKRELLPLCFSSSSSAAPAHNPRSAVSTVFGNTSEWTETHFVASLPLLQPHHLLLLLLDLASVVHPSLAALPAPTRLLPSPLLSPRLTLPVRAALPPSFLPLAPRGFPLRLLPRCSSHRYRNTCSTLAILPRPTSNA